MSKKFNARAYLPAIPSSPAFSQIGSGRRMVTVKRIIIHCAATPPDMDIGAAEIHDWHLMRGWSGVGYHFVIRRDGSVERGRGLDRIGAHTAGHNSDSIGICLVGGVADGGAPEDNYTPTQRESLMHLVYALDAYWMREFQRHLSIHGHNEFANKACPSFDVTQWVAQEYVPFTLAQAAPRVIEATEVPDVAGDDVLRKVREQGWNDGYDEGYAAGLAAVIAMVEGMK